MARIRTIKPEFWTSEQIVECSTTARLLFIGLWNFCDDAGIHPYAPKTIKMQIFPGDAFTPQEIDGLLAELILSGLIKTYHIDNIKYLIITLAAAQIQRRFVVHLTAHRNPSTYLTDIAIPQRYPLPDPAQLPPQDARHGSRRPPPCVNGGYPWP